jgi:hypothetical protein
MPPLSLKVFPKGRTEFLPAADNLVNVITRLVITTRWV